MRGRLHAAVAAVAMAALVSCGGRGADTPTSPTSGARSGTWVGTVSDPDNGTGALRLVLDEFPIDATRSFFTGTWRTSFPDGSRDGGGTVTGTITASTGTLLLAPAMPATCPSSAPFGPPIGSYASPLLTVSATTIGGPYSHARCTGVVSGTLTLTKQ